MYRLAALFLMPFLLFSCSKNPVDTNVNAGNPAKGKIAIVCKSASSATAKITVTERAEIWIWKTLDTMPAIYPLTREAGTTFTGEFEVDSGSYPRISVIGYAPDNTVTYFGSSLNVHVTQLPAVTTVTIGLIPAGTVTQIAGMDFVSIPDGTFQMGDETGDLPTYVRPVHTVTLSGFYMGKYEVTQGQYKEFFENPSGFTGDDNLPVEGVRFLDAIKFCNALSRKAGLPECYNEDTGAVSFLAGGFRLPTEAEWEYACRAGTTTKYYLGDNDNIYDTNNDLARAGWYFYTDPDMDLVKETHPVGQKTPNGWGLYDMHGNVRERCNDWYDKSYYSSSPSVNPLGPQPGSNRVSRGGCSSDIPKNCRSAYRYYNDPTFSAKSLGFRVVCRP